MKGLDLDDVCDAVFSRDTREGPKPKWLSNYGPCQWDLCFPGPKPDWYVDPAHRTKIELPS